MNLRVIIPLKDVPENATVTKPGGVKEYTVRHEVTVYYNDLRAPTKLRTRGCMFLVKDGQINALGEDQMVVWSTDLDELNMRFGDDR